MEYRILGPLEVELDGPPLSVKGRKPRALLALLLLRRNELVPTELLIDDLWGDKAPATAANTLQVYVSQLRKIVGDRVSREGGAYRLRVEPDELDAERFERLAEEGDAALRRRSFREAAELLAEALALWRGPALADLRYESFAQGEIARLEELRLAANENRIEAELGLGRHDQVIGELEALIAEHPAPRAAPEPAHARALPGGAAGRRARRVPGGPPDAPRRARPGARARAARARAGDPPPGRGAVAPAAAAEQRPGARQHARRPQTRARRGRRARCAAPRACSR